MKRLWIALALLAAVFGCTLYNSWYLEGLAEEVCGLLTQAEGQAEAGQWEQAEQLTAAARRRWEEKDVYLHITLRHGDIDQIYTSFREVGEFLACEEQGEYSAANARLIVLLELLGETEKLTLKNVL